MSALKAVEPLLDHVATLHDERKRPEPLASDALPLAAEALDDGYEAAHRAAGCLLDLAADLKSLEAPLDALVDARTANPFYRRNRFIARWRNADKDATLCLRRAVRERLDVLGDSLRAVEKSAAALDDSRRSLAWHERRAARVVVARRPSDIARAEAWARRDVEESAMQALTVWARAHRLSRETPPVTDCMRDLSDECEQLRKDVDETSSEMLAPLEVAEIEGFHRDLQERIGTVRHRLDAEAVGAAALADGSGMTAQDYQLLLAAWGEIKHVRYLPKRGRMLGFLDRRTDVGSPSRGRGPGGSARTTASQFDSRGGSVTDMALGFTLGAASSSGGGPSGSSPSPSEPSGGSSGGGSGDGGGGD